MRGDKTENKPCAAGALQRGTHSKCHAQLEATSDIIICFFFPEPLGQGRSDIRHEGRRCDTKQTFHAAKTFRVSC